MQGDGEVQIYTGIAVFFSVSIVFGLIGLLIFVVHRGFSRADKVSKQQKARQTNTSPHVVRAETVNVSQVSYLIQDVRNAPAHDYHYTRRNFIMTPTERNFYRRLFHLFGKFYFIYPQIHLSTLLDHSAMQSKYWQQRGALSKIQRKSVDYVFCTTDFKPILAIELDDPSHDALDRQERDKFVEDIFREAGLPLIRFRINSFLTDEKIREIVIQAIQG